MGFMDDHLTASQVLEEHRIRSTSRPQAPRRSSLRAVTQTAAAADDGAGPADLNDVRARITTALEWLGDGAVWEATDLLLDLSDELAGYLASGKAA